MILRIRNVIFSFDLFVRLQCIHLTSIVDVSESHRIVRNQLGEVREIIHVQIDNTLRYTVCYQLLGNGRSGFLYTLYSRIRHHQFL